MIYCARPATNTDIPALLALRTEAEQWMEEAQITQWVATHHQRSREVLQQAVESGDAWVITTETGSIAATVTLAGPDMDFWTPSDHPAAGLYVYKMIVGREWAGRDLGGALLNWAGRRAESLGRQWLRLDCRRDNIALHDYYRDHRFELVRIVDIDVRTTGEPTFSGALFQRRSDLQTPTRDTVTDCHAI